jgi:hypothetical protein
MYRKDYIQILLDAQVSEIDASLDKSVDANIVGKKLTKNVKLKLTSHKLYVPFLF